MHTYIAFLRGVNVGGKGLIKMTELAVALSDNELQNVKTYIQSGNVLFESAETDTDTLSRHISRVIEQAFQLHVDIAVFSKEEWKQVVAEAPKWWGSDTTRKHNLLIMIGNPDMQAVVAAVGELKPDIEAMAPGKRVLYQSLSWEKFGRTTGGKLASSPIYKQMTIRNYNTATKLANLLD